MLLEELEEHLRISRELSGLLAEDAAPQSLAELGFDAGSDTFKGRRVG